VLDSFENQHFGLSKALCFDTSTKWVAPSTGVHSSILCVLYFNAVNADSMDLSKYVNVFTGTINGGNTFPGVTAGM
jgi:hypothetical protein